MIKKTLVILNVIIILTLMIVSVSSASTVYGDVNSDGKFTAFDVIYMSRAYSDWKGYTLSEEQVSLADMDDNGKFEAVDCVIAARALVGWEGYTTLPFRGAKLLYNENFEGTDLNSTKWAKCPEWERQGNSVWDDDMSYLDGNGNLILRAEWDSTINKVRCGAIRTMTKNYRPTFTAGMGYYEASIKFPLDDRQDNPAYKGKGPTGIWTSFWMMCGDVGNVDGSSADGVEIDVIESIYSHKGAYNSAIYWDGYGDDKKQSHSGHMYKHDIYDGNFHVIALERTENENIFYIDGKETWRVTNGDKATYQDCYFTQCTEDGYMKLTIEASSWAYNDAGKTEQDMIDSLGDGVEMVVDYVKVYDKNPYR